MGMRCCSCATHPIGCALSSMVYIAKIGLELSWSLGEVVRCVFSAVWQVVQEVLCSSPGISNFFPPHIYCICLFNSIEDQFLHGASQVGGLLKDSWWTPAGVLDIPSGVLQESFQTRGSV